MNVFKLALVVSLLTASIFASNPTKVMFKAIEKADLHLFQQALENGADVNALSDDTGNTPTLEIITHLVPSIISVENRKEGCTVFGITSGLIAGSLALGWFSEEYKYSAYPVLKIATATLAAGIGSGILSHRIAKALFVGNKQTDQKYLDMLITTLNHPDFKPSRENAHTGKTLYDTVYEILHPKFETYTYTTYDYVQLPIQTSSTYSTSLGIAIPHVHTVVHAVFMVGSKPYAIAEGQYSELIRPLFERIKIALGQKY